jgi:hypothetical protein
MTEFIRSYYYVTTLLDRLCKYTLLQGRAGTLQSVRKLIGPIRLVLVFAANTRTFLSSSWDVLLTVCVIRAAQTLGEQLTALRCFPEGTL